MNKEGLLFKLGGKPWKRKWRRYNFKLNQANFLYFQPHECNQPKRIVVTSRIVGASAGETTLIQCRSYFSFVVKFSDDTSSWSLAANTEDERQEWISVLNSGGPRPWSRTRAPFLKVERGGNTSHRELQKSRMMPSPRIHNTSPACTPNTYYGTSLKLREPGRSNSVEATSWHVTSMPLPVGRPSARNPNNYRCADEVQMTVVSGAADEPDREHLYTQIKDPPLSYDDSEYVKMTANCSTDEYVEMKGGVSEDEYVEMKN